MIFVAAGRTITYQGGPVEGVEVLAKDIIAAIVIYLVQVFYVDYFCFWEDKERRVFGAKMAFLRNRLQLRAKFKVGAKK